MRRTGEWKRYLYRAGTLWQTTFWFARFGLEFNCFPNHRALPRSYGKREVMAHDHACHKPRVPTRRSHSSPQLKHKK
ncbi:hypothetical protein BDN72DRAFT_671305 [Pluteus cervinus]|uniref:Uncharacterized protein n=1 Tax=Pluteus cervinus TaxID=181527 RepID=A0ACD3BA14_9AGAR|nr:hypothetical protein BDN72DRAFT_671305 [Pluteus cervinus]